MLKFILTFGFILCFTQIGFSQSWLTGKWEGVGREKLDSLTWSMQLQARNGKYLIKYPSLGCRGEWRLVSFNRYSARFREIITVNKEACEPTGNVTIKRLSGNRVQFNYSYNRSRKLDASAILRKQR